MSYPVPITPPPYVPMAYTMPSYAPYPPMGSYNIPLERFNLPLTLFVGNISELVADNLVLQVLQRCGNVNSWKRIRGDAGKLQAFGFCEFATPEGALKAMKVLGKIVLADKLLKVSANNTNKTTLEEYEKAKQEAHLEALKEEGKTEEDLKQIEKEEMEQLQKSIEDLVSNYISASQDSGALTLRQTLLSSERDDNQSHLTSGETKDDAANDEKEEGAIDTVDKDGRDRELSPDEQKRREMQQIHKEKVKKVERRDKERLKEMGRIKDRDKERETQVRRKTEKEWDFMVHYDDDEKDYKYYGPSQLEKKKRDREREIELEEKDRLNEEKEAEERRQRDFHLALKRKEEEEEAKQLEEIRLKEQKERELMQQKLLEQQRLVEEQRRIEVEKQRKIDMERRHQMELAQQQQRLLEEKKMAELARLKELERLRAEDDDDDDDDEKHRKRRGENNSNSDKTRRKKRNKADSDSEEDIGGVVFNEQELLKSGLTTEQVASKKRRIAKTIIRRIPVTQEELFKVQLEGIDETLIARRVLPWVNKKIVDYVGKEEPTLAAFVCEKIAKNTLPECLLADVEQILDEEAALFMVKLWRLLIYESEAKRLGVN